MNLTQDDENELQAVAHELENIAETLRARAWAGRDAGTLADVPDTVRAMELRIAGVLRLVPAGGWALHRLGRQSG